MAQRSAWRNERRKWRNQYENGGEISYNSGIAASAKSAMKSMASENNQ